MTSIRISEQIAAIKNATAKASSSKEAAAAFLINAGIIKEHASGLNVADLSKTGTQIVKKINSKGAQQV